MPFRQLPASDPTRSQALSAGLKKSAAVTGTARLAAFVPRWEKEVTGRDDALGKQTSITTALNLAGDKPRMAVSHFIQVFQLGAALGVFSPSGRAVYDLSVNEELSRIADGSAHVR